jgi:MFS family permease
MLAQTTPATPVPRLFYGWVILFACFLTTMMASGTMMAFGVFINPLADDMGWSHSALSFTYALSAIVTGVGVLAIGSYMHIYSLRLIFVSGVMVHGLGIYMTSTANSIESFYVWYGIVAALGRSTFFISTTTLVTRWFEQRRGMAMGLMMAGNGIGPFMFSPVVTWLIVRWDWRTAFVAISFAMTGVLIIAYFLMRNHPHEIGQRPYGARDEPAAPPASLLQANPPNKAASNEASVGSLWGRVLRHQGFWTLSLINFFCCVCHSIPLVHTVGFALSAGLSAFAASWVLAVMGLTSVVGRIFWGFFADRHGARLTLMLTLFMQGAFMLWLVNSQDPVIFFLYALVWGFGYGGVGTQYGVVAREIYGTRLFGPGYSGQSCFAMVGMAVGGFLGGYLFEVSHSYVSAWLVSFGAGLISSLLALDLINQGERTQAETAAVAPAWTAPVPESSMVKR